jgi:hypothetical protein
MSNLDHFFEQAFGQHALQAWDTASISRASSPEGAAEIARLHGSAQK